MTPESSEEEVVKSDLSDDSEVSILDENDECGSSDDDMESGSFFR